MKHIIILAFLFLTLGFKSDKPAYVLYNKEGKNISYQGLLSEMIKADFVFIGELHNNPIVHWLQLELTKALFDEHGDNLVIGAEMFEADNQIIIDEYLKGFLTTKKFEAECRLWDNYKTDYKPLLEFAKPNGIKFIATNIPRRYASMVYNHGFEGLEKLSAEAKVFMVPLPMVYDSTINCYSEMLKMGGGHGGTNLPKAQALKDATMAHFIQENYNRKGAFVHYNGVYHSDNHEGIVWYLKKAIKNAKVFTVSCVQQSDISKLEQNHMGKADIIICVPDNMTTTY